MMQKAVLAVSLVWLAVASAAGQNRAAQPLSISIASDGRAVVLQTDGSVVAIDIDKPAKLDVVYRLPAGYRAVDVAARNRNAAPSVCVSAFRETTSGLTSWLVQPTGASAQVWSWLPGRGFHGSCAIDEGSQTAYVPVVRSGQIYAVPIGQNKAELVLAVSGGKNLQLGPMAVHHRSGRLVVADVESGRIYTVDRETGASEIARIPQGEIRALAFDPAGEYIYAADSDTETIWRVAAGSSAPTAIRFSEIGEFREPTGVAVDPEGRVWVADRRLRRIIKLSLDGRSADIRLDW